MSDKRTQQRHMSNSAYSQPEQLRKSGNQWLDVPDKSDQFSSDAGKDVQDVHSAGAKGNQPAPENFDEAANDCIRKSATNTLIKTAGPSKDKRNLGKSSSIGVATSVHTGTSNLGVQSSSDKKQRFKVNPTSSFNIDQEVTPKSDLNLFMQPQSSNQSLEATGAKDNPTERCIENKKPQSQEQSPSEEEEENDSEMAKKQAQLRRIAALLKGEKMEVDAEEELEDLKEREEFDPDPDYEEGIFIFRSNTGSFLNCQIPVDEEVYLQNYVAEAGASPRKENEKWEIASKIVVYDRRSLYLFHHQHYFRRMMVNIIENKNFDNFIILMIFCNSMAMAIYDYSDRKNECTKNIILEQFSFVFTMVFNVECIFKIIGMGFFMHKNSYLRLDMWNWLDFCVVLVGIIEVLPFKTGSVNMKGLRTLRVLRPLKSIKSLPAMRKLIGSLGSSIGPLTNVVVFLLFVFLLFGILGVTQFEGQMYQRCRLTTFPIERQGEMVWPFDPSDDRLCSLDSSGRQCPIGQVCGTPRDVGLPISSDKPETQELINFGVTTFDHLGHAMVVIFQMITLEGWVFMMYNLQDAGAPWLATAYCILLVIICAFFVLNVILAVLGDALSGQELESPEDNLKKLEAGISMRRARKQKEKRRASQTSSKKRRNSSQSPSNSKVSEIRTENSQEIEPFQNTPGSIELNSERVYKRSNSMRHEETEKNPDFQAASNEVDQQLQDVDQVLSENSQQPQVVNDQQFQTSPDQTPKIGKSSVLPVIEEIREEQSDAVMSYSHTDLNSERKKSLFRSSSLKNTLHTKASKKITPVDNSVPQAVADGTAKDDHLQVQTKGIKNEMDESANQDLNTPSRRSDGAKSGVSSQDPAKRDPNYLPPHASRNFVFKINYRFCSHPFFDTFITGLIVCNTVVLALDRQRVGPTEQKVYDFLNDIFTWAFVGEMVIKLLGLGFTEYAKDNFNKFDAVIVVLSLVEFVLMNAGLGGNLGAFSALRGFRLMRVFKLARGWKDLRILLNRMGKSIIGLSTFSVLMLIIIFIFMLLGMELFAFKIRYDEDDVPIPLDQKGGSSPRENFNTPWSAFITIFIVIVGDDWNTIMYSHYRVLMEASTTQGYVAVSFFIVLFIMGNLVLLNLFLAILLQNFDEGSDDADEENENDDKIQLSVKERISTCCKLCCLKCCRCCKKDDDSDNEQSINSPISPLGKQSLLSALGPETPEQKISRETQQRRSQIFGRLRQLRVDKERESLQLEESARQLMVQQASVDLKNNSWKESSESSSSGSEPLFSQRSINIPGNQQDGKESEQAQNMKKNHSFVEPTMSEVKFSRNDEQKLSKSHTMKVRSKVTPENDFGIQKNSADLAGSSISLVDKMKVRMNQKLMQDRSQTTGGSAMVKLLRSKMQRQIVEQEQREKKLMQMKTVANISIAKIKQLELKTNQDGNKVEVDEPEGTSLFLFGPKNGLRIAVCNLVKTKHFDNAILLLILISTVLLCMEQPLADPNGEYVRVLGIFDKITTFLFILECVVKVITYGYACNGKNSYMNSSWNVMDFIIVFFSIFDLLPTGQEIGVLKIIRLARVLRPLRMIARNEGMKIAIESLIMSIKGVGNVLVISILILLLFAILGTNFYKGLFQTCNFANVPVKQQEDVHTMWECFDAGGEWIQIQSNFDNAAASMITLFTAATTEGWVEVMNNAVDASSYQVMPIQDNGPMHALFFVFFVLIMALFILNLFVGVVINKFNEEKERLAHNTQLTHIQVEYCDTMVKVYSAEPKVVYEKTGNYAMDFLQTIASSKFFDNFIFGCIVVNTITMAVTWFDEPIGYTNFMKKVNLTFAIIYTIECSIKLYVFRREYFRDGWNLFDFVIVIAAWLGLFADLVLKLNIGAVTTIIRSFRIARIFKMIKRFKQLNKIFNTFISALPQLGNIGTLLFIMLLLYAVAGVFFFSHVRFGDAITVHTNFQNWPNAMLTLLRCSTGEAFNELMWELALGPSIDFQCSPHHQTYEEIQASGGLPNGCGSWATSTMFFISFIVLISFIFVNMFIAIILEGFDNSAKDQNMQINEEVIDRYIEAWSKYDLKGTGLIPVDKLDMLVQDLIMLELEIKGPERKYKNERVLFNLSNDDYLLVFTKIKREVDLETPFIKSFTRDIFKQRAINRYWNKFCWEFCVPSYCSFTRYNFHDILVALVKHSFAVRHSNNYTERQQRIKLSIENGIPLQKFDRIREDDEEFMRLPEIKMELFLETNNKDFSLVINRLEQIKGMRTKNKIAKYEQMKKLRITCGLPYKDQLDEHDGYIFDSAHVRAVQVVIKHLEAKKERKRLAALPPVTILNTDSDSNHSVPTKVLVGELPSQSPKQTSSKWESTPAQSDEMDPTTAKKLDYTRLEVNLSVQKVTCRMPFSDEKVDFSDTKIVTKSLSVREEDPANINDLSASNHQQNVKRGIIAEDINLQATQKFTNRSITNARIIGKSSVSRSPSKLACNQSLHSANSGEQPIEKQNSTPLIQDEAEIERVFQSFVAAADEKDKLVKRVPKPYVERNQVMPAARKEGAATGLDERAVTGLDDEIEEKILRLIQDDNLYMGQNMTDGEEGGGGMRAHDDSPLEIQLMSGDVQSSIGSLQSLKQQPLTQTNKQRSSMEIDHASVIYNGPYNQQQENQRMTRHSQHRETQIDQVQKKLVSSPQIFSEKKNNFPITEEKRISMATAAIVTSSPYGQDQLHSRRNNLLNKASSSFSPRPDWIIPPEKKPRRMHSYESCGIIAQSLPSFRQASHLSNHEKIQEIQKQEKYELMLAQRRNTQGQNQNSRQYAKQGSFSPQKVAFIPAVFHNNGLNTQQNNGMGSSYQQKAYAQMVKANSQPNKRQFFGSQGFSQRILPAVFHNNFQKEDSVGSLKDAQEPYQMVAPIETTHLVDFSQDRLHRRNQALHAKVRTRPNNQSNEM